MEETAGSHDDIEVLHGHMGVELRPAPEAVEDGDGQRRRDHDNNHRGACVSVAGQNSEARV